MSDAAPVTVGQVVVGHVVVGPRGHGVVEVALAAAQGPLVHLVSPADATTEALASVAGADVLHLHYTDRLYGDTCEQAAEAFVTLRAELARPVVVTLHDLPMPSQGAALFRRRLAAYTSVIAACSGIVTSSCHEAGLLRHERPATVVPLPIDPLPLTGPPPVTTREVGVLGWIYPGKGHDVVAAALPPGVGLAALGGVSPGHDDLLHALRGRLGNRLRHMGFLPEAELLAQMRHIGVPVAAHREVSASASVGSWLAAGRRPLVADGPWARELLDRCPGSVVLFRPDELSGAITRALEQPDGTWLGDTRVGPSSGETARRLQAFCDTVA